MNPIQTFAGQVTANVEKVIVGKRSAIEMALVALLCDGHVLIEDVPGVGKTMLARAAWARCPTCPCRQPSSDRSVGKHIGVQAVEARGKVKRVVLNILTGRQP